MLFFPLKSSTSTSTYTEQALFSSETSKLSNFPSFFRYFATIVAISIKETALFLDTSSFNFKYSLNSFSICFPNSEFGNVTLFIFVSKVVCLQWSDQ